MANGKKPSKDAEHGRRRRSLEHADWSSAEAGLLRDVIVNIAKHDGAVRFGYSTDGGAFSIGIYGDGKPFTEFIPSTGDVNDFLEELKLDYE